MRNCVYMGNQNQEIGLINAKENNFLLFQLGQTMKKEPAVKILGQELRL